MTDRRDEDAPDPPADSEASGGPEPWTPVQEEPSGSPEARTMTVRRMTGGESVVPLPPDLEKERELESIDRRAEEDARREVRQRDHSADG
jgi:hypothetical protein